MKQTNFIAKIILLMALSACINEEKALEGQLIETKSLIDNKQFIKEGKLRGNKVVEFGPKADEVNAQDEARSITDGLVDEEVAPSYSELQDTSETKIFPVDLNMENVDIRAFTQMMSRITGVNFLVSDEVTGTVTAKLQDVSWPNALDSVLSLKGFAKHVDNEANIIRIHNQATVVQLENFERQRKSDLQKTAQLDKANEPLYTEIFKLFYTKPTEVKTILQNVLGIGPNSAPTDGSRNVTAQITIDERVNQLIVKARKDDLRIMKKLISKIDSRTKQVFIEAFVVEVSDDFSKALGVQLGANAATAANTTRALGKELNARITGPLGTTGSAVDEVDGATIVNLAAVGATSGVTGLFGLGDTADLRVALTALEKNSVSKIISNPRIFTLDNQEATIFQGDDIPYATTSAEGTTTEFKKAGLKLAVKPTVVGDGNLMMAVTLNKDSADTSQANPPISTSQIVTNMVTKDGSIVVIGGIYTQIKTDSNEKVPFFGDVPVAGKLFRNDTRKNNRKELMIFIAPKII